MATQIKLARRLENAMHGAQRAATLTKRLLAFSRQQPLNPAVLDVNRVLNGLSDFLAARAERRHFPRNRRRRRRLAGRG